MNEGFCNKNGKCQCKKGFYGENCEFFNTTHKKIEKKRCKNNCSEHGICLNNKLCLCDVRFDGLACEYQIKDVKLIMCRTKCYEDCLQILEENMHNENKLTCINKCVQNSCFLDNDENYSKENNKNSSDDNSNYLEFSSEN